MATEVKPVTWMELRVIIGILIVVFGAGFTGMYNMYDNIREDNNILRGEVTAYKDLTFDKISDMDKRLEKVQTQTEFIYDVFVEYDVTVKK